MALTYEEPGVNVSEILGRNITPLLAGPTTLCLVGLATGVINGFDQITLQDGDDDNNPITPDVPVPTVLPGVPVDADLNAVTEVRDAFTGVVYTVGTDYTVSTSGKSLTRVSTGAIADGTVVRVKYNYTPQDYFYAERFDNLNAIEERFGSAWSADGLSVGSPVSQAALVAFENGAPFVVIQPLFTVTGTARVQPTAAQAATVGVWQTTLQGLRDNPEVNVVVPIIGQVDSTDNSLDVTSATQLSIFNAVQDHIWFMRTQDQYVVGVLGEDSSAGVEVTTATVQNHATSLQTRYDGDTSSHLVLVSPSKFVRPSASSNDTLYVGGQYVAAGIAGQLAGRRVQTPLTRKPLAGFTQVAERRTKEEKNVEAAVGILVVEQRGLAVQIRHGLTLDNTSVAARELSVVRSKHFMVESLYNTFEDQVIGQIFADTQAPVVVRSTVIATLERLKSLQVIDKYRNVDARLLQGDPTRVEVRFSYAPFFPLNYIDIVFSLDLTNQTITTVTPGAGR